MPVNVANKIECALNGVEQFDTDCSAERGDGSALTLRHEDGGFRKLVLENDGTIDSADGSETIRIQMLTDGRAEISVGKDRYRLPSKL